jgi:hypothetical protein
MTIHSLFVTESFAPRSGSQSSEKDSAETMLMGRLERTIRVEESAFRRIISLTDGMKSIGQLSLGPAA